MSLKKEDKAKVGRPKLAEPELIKDSWCRIASCSVISIVMLVCAIGIITNRTPFQVLTFQNPYEVQASVGNVNNVRTINPKTLGNSRTIPAKRAEKRIINANGEVTRVIPANPVKVIKVD
ncbi:MAG: hypothetical protein U0M66_06105 [Bacilli bacterium]|mgnify:CR=1 FL=1|nr:hypothetical protein [Bacilli bacterium]